MYEPDEPDFKSKKPLKGGYNMLTKCKSFADAFIIQTCGNNSVEHQLPMFSSVQTEPLQLSVVSCKN